MLDTVVGYGQIIIADLILSGDNALVIGMAAAGLPSEQRKKAIFYGMVIAAVLKNCFRRNCYIFTRCKRTFIFGSVLLFWVCWTLFKDIRSGGHSEDTISNDGSIKSSCR